MTTPTHDLAIARAERDAWQSTCEELHRAIAGRDVEIEAHLGRIDAADQRARSLDAALTAEREAGRGLVAQVEALRAEAATACANLNRCDDERASAIGERDAAIARAEKAEAERDALRLRVTEDERDERSADAEIAKLRAELAELRARPVLTVEAFTEAYIKTKHGGKAWPGEEADRRGLTAQFRATFAALGPVALPAQDRAEELCRAYHERAADMDGHMVGRWQYHGPESQAICTEAMERALASLGAPPTSPPAARPVFAGVSEDELIRLFYVVGTDGIDHGEQCPPIDISDRNGIRAVLARLEVSLVTPEFLRRIPLYTKHGPGGRGNPGPCDAACVKCEAERMVKAAPAREVAPTRVLVHADGGACHGSRVVDGRYVGCGIAPDMQSTSLWLDADARPVQCEPAKVVAPTLVAVSDEELAVAFYSEPERPALRECIDAADLAGIRAVRAKLGAAVVTEERLREAIREERHVSSFVAEDTAKGVLARLRATAAKGGES